MKRIILVAVFAFSFGILGSAQTKSETKLYNKTMAKPSVKAYDKFLAKYPESTYALEVLTLRDQNLFDALDKTDAAAVEAFAEAHITSPIYDQIDAVVTALNTTDISKAEALNILKALAPGAVDAVAYKKTGVDYVYGVEVGPEIKLYKAARKSGDWTLEATTPVEKYNLDSKLTDSKLVGELVLEDMNAKKVLVFNYLNSVKGNTSLEFVANLYDIKAEASANAMFYGKDMASKNDPYKIEGQCPEALNTSSMTGETAYLLTKINNNPLLVPIKKADALTDDSIAWWLDKNPTAQTKGSKLTFGALDDECGLIEGFKKTTSRDKVNSASYQAALFDTRGYTVVVGYSKSAKNYFLVWAEPVCKNKKTDRLLNNIYFKDANVLNLFYYKGNTTFNYDVNLSSKSIKR